MTEIVEATLNGQFTIKLPKHRADRPEWYTEQGWEKARLESMEATTKPGDVVYYIGAEEGEMCALLAMWGGSNIVMFEPNDRVWPNIKAIWEANNIVIPYACYVGFAANETEGTGLYTSQWPPCADGEVIHDHGFKELHDSGNIPKTKIDDLSLALEPDMISLDVEGSEWEVLRGAEQTLRQHRPRIYLSLHPEFMFRIYGEYGYDLRAWIKNIGYKETLLDYQHEVHLLYESTDE